MLADAQKSARQTASTRRRPRLHAPERREAIIRAAVQVFSRHGFRGTTTRQLAAAAGVSEPVLYQHFATKDRLYTAIIDWLMGQVFDFYDEEIRRLAAAADDEAFFSHLARQVWRFHEQHPEVVRLLYYSGLEGHELSVMWHERVISPGSERIVDYIRKRIRAGAFRKVDPFVVARLLMGGVAHFAFTNMVLGCRLPPVEPATYLRQVVRTVLDGVRAPAPGAADSSLANRKAARTRR